MAGAWIARGWLKRLAPQDEGDALARRRIAVTPAGARALRQDLGIEA
jgi:hypothetical protein